MSAPVRVVTAAAKEAIGLIADDWLIVVGVLGSLALVGWLSWFRPSHAAVRGVGLFVLVWGVMALSLSHAARTHRAVRPPDAG